MEAANIINNSKEELKQMQMLPHLQQSIVKMRTIRVDFRTWLDNLMASLLTKRLFQKLVQNNGATDLNIKEYSSKSCHMKKGSTSEMKLKPRNIAIWKFSNLNQLAEVHNPCIKVSLKLMELLSINKY
jgi:hypothetical protein